MNEIDELNINKNDFQQHECDDEHVLYAHFPIKSTE